eukprot:g10062.t1
MIDDLSEEIQEQEENVCALFATSMPRDIWTNPSLAALAGLIDEDEDHRDKTNGEAAQGKHTNDEAAPRQVVSKAGDGDSANATEEASPIFAAVTSENQQNDTNGSSGTSRARHQRREDTRRRRHDRRATPYDGGGGGFGGRRGRGEDPSSELGAGGRRTGPTTGETQVLMSLWGL